MTLEAKIEQTSYMFNRDCFEHNLKTKDLEVSYKKKSKDFSKYISTFNIKMAPRTGPEQPKLHNLKENFI